MPAAAIAIPLITSVVSTGMAINQASKANKAAKRTQEEIDNYERQDLVNPNLGLQVSTLGADRQREDMSRAIATMANTAAMGGSRAILGLAPNMLSQQMQQQQQIAANLDQQEMQRQAAVAQGEGMVMGMTEQRENNDLIGLGNSLNVARQERAMGTNNAIQSGLALANTALEMNRQGLFKKQSDGQIPQAAYQPPMQGFVFNNNDILGNLKLNTNPFGMPYLNPLVPNNS